MNTIQKLVVNAEAVTVLFGLAGCTVIGAGVGAVGGGVIGNNM
jgi:hypothetical protein